MSVVVVDPATGLQYFTVGAAPFSPSIREVAGEISWLEILNESPYLLFAQMGSLIIPIPAWYGYPIQSSDGVGFNLPLSLTPLLLGTTANAPSSACVVTVYGVGERPAQQQPYPLVRQANIGNQVSVTSTTSLKNDGNLPGTQIIESTPSDQGVSAFNLNNDGSGLWQVLSAAVQRIVAQVVRGNAGVGKASIQIGDSGDPSILTMIGNLDKIRSDGGKITSDGSGNVTLTSPAMLTGRVHGDGHLIVPRTTTSAAGPYVDFDVDAGTHRIIMYPQNNGTDTNAYGFDFRYRAASGGATTPAITIGPAGGLGFDNGAITTDGLGNYSKIGNQAVVGFGLPLAAAVTDGHLNAVTVTTQQTIATFTAPTNGVYRVSVYAQPGNSVSGQNITLQLRWTDSTLTQRTIPLVLYDNTGAAKVFNGSTSITNGQYTGPAILINGGSTISVLYQDPGGSPNDQVSALIERIS